MLYFTFQTNDLHEAQAVFDAYSKLLAAEPLPQPKKITVPNDRILTMKEILDARPYPSDGSTETRWKLQGQYAGVVRHLSEADKNIVRATREAHGIVRAIVQAKAIYDTKKAMGTPSPNGRRHRAKCGWCHRGYLASRKDSRFCSKRCRDTQYREAHKQGKV